MRIRSTVVLAAVLLGAVAVQQAAAAGAQPLVEAAKRLDTATVRQLLQRDPASVNVAEADGTTALHWAADQDDLAMVDLLLGAGADARAANRYGVTAMYSAALHGNAAMLARLIAAGADVDAALPEGETALMTAARTGRVEAIKLLLARGAEVNAREGWKQQTALMWAAHEGNAAAVAVLLEAGAAVADRSRFGWTPLLFAARQGHPEVIELLVQAGADVDEKLPDGTSALVTAVQGLNYETAAALLDLGIDPNAALQGWTALHQIAWSRRPQRGQNNPGQKPKGGMSSLDLARALVEHGADVNARQTTEPTSDMEGRNSLNRFGATPFFLAAKSVDVPLMEVLLGLGADPFLGNIEGDSPLMVAAGVGVYSQGESPGDPVESAEAVKLLLDLGASVDDVDRDGETALHGPAWRGSNEAVTLLVDAGARLDVRNNRGWLPLTIADGVYYNARVMMNKHTARLLRELMTERGLDTTDSGTNIGGALRENGVADDLLDADDPAEVQRRLIEEQQRRQEALKRLQEQGQP
ncbi:MAG: ankyrin repeat domain-containing protein [Vicinamibacterales bacterium]